MDYRFADCLLDTSVHRLTRDGTEVHVEPQVFDLLVALARAAPDLLSYDEMIAQVWNGRIVSDAALSARISAARAAIGDSGKAQAIIRTVPRRGAQFVVPVEGGLRPAAPSVAAPRQVIRYARSGDGTAIAYAVSGFEDGPVLLRGGHWMSHLEHDWTSPVWRPWLDRLGNGRRLVRYDPRGTGLSDRDAGDVGFAASVADFGAVLDASGAARADVLAASQSAPVALAHAARHPGRFRRIVIVNGFAEGSYVRGDAEGTRAMVAMIRSGWGDADSPFVRAFATLFLPEATREELAGLVAMQALSASAEMAAALREAIGHIDVKDLLATVDVPVLILSSKGDAIHPQSQGQLLAHTLPNAEFQSLDTANHVIAPSGASFQVMMDAVDRFLAD